MRKIILLIIIVCPFFLFAKEKELSLVQLSGIVFDADSNSVIPYTTITDVSYQNRATVANYNGYFSFVVREGDTIEVSSIGFSTRRFIVPRNLLEPKFTIMIKMKPEVQYLNAVKVFPWATVEEFTKEFLELPIYEDAPMRAKNNTNRRNLQVMLLNLPRDGKEQMTMYFQTEHYNQMYRTSAPSFQLLNPLAWATFLKQISQGQQKIKTTSLQEE